MSLRDLRKLDRIANKSIITTKAFHKKFIGNQVSHQKKSSQKNKSPKIELFENIEQMIKQIEGEINGLRSHLDRYQEKVRGAVLG